MNKELFKYFMVIAKCGHVGKRNYVPIKFAVVAVDGKEAAKVVRQFPRVKHDHKDAILSVKCISFEEFLEIKEMNDKDPYLKCHSKKEQKAIDMEDRIEKDPHYQSNKVNKQARRDRVDYKLRKYRIMERCDVQEVYGYAC